MHARTILSGGVFLVLLVAGLLMLEAGSTVVASTGQTPTNPPLSDTPTGVPPYPSATPVDSAFAPIVFEQARLATATISPDATPTPTDLPPPIGPSPTFPPVGPYSEYAPLVLDTVSTPTSIPTPTATISPDATPTPTDLPPPQPTNPTP